VPHHHGGKIEFLSHGHEHHGKVEAVHEHHEHHGHLGGGDYY
jgi:hypothetical protein